MTDNTEAQRLTRLRRLRRQIAAGLQADLDREQAFQVHGSVRELLKGGRAEVRRAGWLRAQSWSAGLVVSEATRFCSSRG